MQPVLAWSDFVEILKDTRLVKGLKVEALFIGLRMEGQRIDHVFGV
jgi:hypothetical protein